MRFLAAAFCSAAVLAAGAQAAPLSAGSLPEARQGAEIEPLSEGLSEARQGAEIAPLSAGSMPEARQGAEIEPLSEGLPEARQGTDKGTADERELAFGETKPKSESDLPAAMAAVEQEIHISAARTEALKAEVKALAKDQAAVSRALAQAAELERALSGAVAAGEAKLGDLAAAERQRRQRLNQNRAELAEILAALEKLGISPPPAVLVRADDIGQSLQAASLLAALLPQMEEKTKAAQADMDALKQTERSIKAEQRDLSQKRAQRQEEQLRLSLLQDEKAAQANQKRRNLQEEEQNRKILAEKALSLQDLLSGLEKQRLSFGNSANQMQIAVKFSALRGQLAPPAGGKLLAGFNRLYEGKKIQGEIWEMAAGAAVLAPAEGVVRYAGKFRSYGQVVILDMGEDYYLILAGLGQIQAEAGQFLLQGEPAGNMESALPHKNQQLMIERAGRELYIEIRKAGQPVNPAPWWRGLSPEAERAAAQ